MQELIREEDEEQKLETGVPAPEKMDNRWLFDYDYLWLGFEANLRGGKLIRNPKSESWEIRVPKDSQPFMNDKGVRDVMAMLRANVNMVSGSSVYDEDRIREWNARLQVDLATMLFVKIDDYEIEAGKLHAIISTIMQAFESNMRKSLGGKALILSMQGERVLETRTHDLTPPVPFIKRIF